MPNYRKRSPKGLLFSYTRAVTKAFKNLFIVLSVLGVVEWILIIAYTLVGPAGFFWSILVIGVAALPSILIMMAIALGLAKRKIIH